MKTSRRALFRKAIGMGAAASALMVAGSVKAGSNPKPAKWQVWQTREGNPSVLVESVIYPEGVYWRCNGGSLIREDFYASDEMNYIGMCKPISAVSLKARRQIIQDHVELSVMRKRATKE
jgi:hypothetical protein